MATFEKGILGGFSGKIGNVVGARWRGKDIMRSVPRSSSRLPTTRLTSEEGYVLFKKFGNLNDYKKELSRLSTIGYFN